MISKLLTRISLIFSLLLAAGCASQHGQKTSDYNPIHGSNLAADTASASAEARQTVDQRLLLPKAGGASAEDLAVGEKIRAMLMEDKTLAPPPSNVITVVSKGVVTMKGFVRSRRAAFELHQRIASLPGVQFVQDELVLWNGHKI